MSLIENAFTVIGAMPWDSRSVLTDKADEAALLRGVDTESALNQLMQMNRRISAELAFLPGADQEAAEAAIEYARLVADGQQAKVPSVEKLGTALAQANALLPLFEIWPVDKPELFEGLCIAMDQILSQITAEETLQAGNESRRAGKWDLISDVSVLAEPLNEHLRELCIPVSRALEKTDDKSVVSILTRLLQANEIDQFGNIAQTIRDTYGIRIHEKAEKLKTSINAELKRMDDSPKILKNEIDYLCRLTIEWCELTEPLRMIPGIEKTEARGIGSGVRNQLVKYINTANPVQKQKVIRVPTLGGMRVITMTYQTKKEAIDETVSYIWKMIEHFPEQTELTAQLKADQKTLNDMIGKEQEMLRNEEIRLGGR